MRRPFVDFRNLTYGAALGSVDARFLGDRPLDARIGSHPSWHAPL